MMLHDALTLSLSPLPFVSPHEYVAPLHHLTPSSRELSLHLLTFKTKPRTHDQRGKPWQPCPGCGSYFRWLLVSIPW